MGEVKLKLNPFRIPNFVVLQNQTGVRSDGIPLQMIEAEMLSIMCEDFRRGVFEKAGKIDPKSLLNEKNTNSSQLKGDK